MSSFGQPYVPERENAQNTSELMRVSAEEFLLSAVEELGRAGLDASEVRTFSESFNAACAKEVALNEQGQGTPFEDIDDFVDETLQRTIKGLDNKKLQDDLGMLLELRAEQRSGGAGEPERIN